MKISHSGISCPHCGKAFTVDETGYADILKQVRDEEFATQLNERLGQAERENEAAVQLAKTKAENALEQVGAAKDLEIQALQAKLESSATEQDLAITLAVSMVEKERDDLSGNLERASIEKELSEKALKDKAHSSGSG